VAYFASGAEGSRDKLGKGEVKRRIGFVRQQDFLVECLTGECFSDEYMAGLIPSARDINLCCEATASNHSF
jgi:hypothetical protein